MLYRLATGRQILDRDMQCDWLDWRPVLRNRKRIHRSRHNRSRIVLLDDIVLSLKSLVQF